MILPESNARTAALQYGSTIILSALAVLVMFLLTVPAAAQPGLAMDESEAIEKRADTGRSASPQWKPHFDEQMARTLRNVETGTARATLLRTLISVSANEGKNLDYLDTVPSLLYVVEHDSSPQRRLLALQALECIGPERTSVDLYRDAVLRIYNIVETDTSVAVRRAGADVVGDVQSGSVGS